MAVSQSKRIELLKFWGPVLKMPRVEISQTLHYGGFSLDSKVILQVFGDLVTFKILSGRVWITSITTAYVSLFIERKLFLFLV
jgi:hypothetical protein